MLSVTYSFTNISLCFKLPVKLLSIQSGNIFLLNITFLYIGSGDIELYWNDANKIRRKIVKYDSNANCAQLSLV